MAKFIRHLKEGFANFATMYITLHRALGSKHGEMIFLCEGKDILLTRIPRYSEVFDFSLVNIYFAYNLVPTVTPSDGHVQF